MFHQVFVCDSAPEDLKPEEPMDTSQLEQEFQVPIVIKQEEILLSTEETPSEPSFDYGSNVNEDVVLAMETSQPKEERKLSLDTIYTEPAPSIEQHLGSDAKLQTSFVKLTDVKFDKLLSHVMEDKVLLKDLENKFFMDSVDDIKKEEKDPDLGDPNVTYNLVEKIKPEVKTVKTEIVIKEELDSDSMNVEEEDTEDNLANENTEEENLVKRDQGTSWIDFAQEVVDSKNLVALTPLLITCKTEVNISVKVEGQTKNNPNTAAGCVTEETIQLASQKLLKADEITSSEPKQNVETHCSRKEIEKGGDPILQQLLETTKELSEDTRNKPAQKPKDSESPKPKELGNGHQSETDCSFSPVNDTEGESDWEEEYLNSRKNLKSSGSKSCDLNSSNVEEIFSVCDIRETTTNTVDCTRFKLRERKPSQYSETNLNIPFKMSKGSKKSKCKAPNKEKNENLTAKSATNVSSNEHSDDFEKYFKLMDSVLKGERRPDRRVRKKPWMCDVCGKCYKGQSELESHKNFHNNLRPYKCSDCDSHFTSTHLMKMHFNTVHLKRKKVFLCSQCGETSASEEYILVHEAAHRGAEIDKSFSCPECGLKYETMFQMKRHLDRHRRKTKCGKCKRVFASSAFRRLHMEQEHGIKKEYKCASCDKIFPDRRYLAQHKKSHSTVLKFFCDVCGKGFKQKHHIGQHMITHSDARPIACPLCDERFKRPTHLKQHVAAFHDKQKR